MKERILYLDHVRIFTAYLVIFAHLITPIVPIRNFIYAFHMPLFFIVSGMLTKHRLLELNLESLKLVISEQTNRIIKPTLFFILFFIIVMAPLYQTGICNIQKDFSVEIGDNILETIGRMLYLTCKNTWHSGKICNGVVWFLFVLFWCNIYHVLFNKKKIVGVFVIIFGCGATIVTNGRHMPFFIGQFFISYPFFIFGYYLKDLLNDIVQRDSNKKYIPILLVATFLLTLLNERVEILSIIIGRLPRGLSILVFYLNGITGSLMLMLLSTCIRKSYCSNSLGNSLISILGFQAIFIYLYKNLIGYNQNLLITAISSIAIFGLCYILHVIIMRNVPCLFGK